ncbi:MAG: hypothetical protein RIS70_2594 [Planctomycetota bacterium]
MNREDSTPVPPMNPYQPGDPNLGQGTEAKASADRAAYNIVSDTVVGVNVRGRDNLFQAIFILVSALLGAAIGARLKWFNKEWDAPVLVGALAGLLAGLVIGLFASGIVLMVYRTIRHLQGKHD